jgi:hypothetical protein
LIKRTVEIDDDAIGEREDRTEEAPGPSKKKRKKGRQPQKWQENIDGIERAKSLKNKMMKCMDNILDM